MIEYLVGDATHPNGPDVKIIAHVVNDIGRWGRGFVLSVTKRYPVAEHAYREWSKGEGEHPSPFALGETQLVHVGDGIHVANMVGQHDVMTVNGVPPIRYDALESCLTKLRIFAKLLDASVHMPRIGCGLAGGKWSEVEAIVNRVLAHDVRTVVYDFDTKDNRTVPWNK